MLLKINLHRNPPPITLLVEDPRALLLPRVMVARLVMVNEVLSIPPRSLSTVIHTILMTLIMKMCLSHMICFIHLFQVPKSSSCHSKILMRRFLYVSQHPYHHRFLETPSKLLSDLMMALRKSRSTQPPAWPYVSRSP